jgi:transposase
MFLRQKVSGPNVYLQIVEGMRENGKVRQRVICTLGRLDDLQQSGKLDALLASGTKFSDKISIIGEYKKGGLAERGTKKIGPALVFSRLWKETGIEQCLRSLLQERRFQFDVQGAIFMTVLHRLLDPGSDRAASKWKDDYAFSESISQLDLHQLYRAMAWLGESLDCEGQQGRTPYAPRCVKDLVEENLFLARRQLFTQVALVFFDTTSIYFEGKGGQTLGKHGKSKDHRPDLKQMVVGLVLDGQGRPICCELWPGNTADVKTLLPVVDRLGSKFRVTDICIVADRGMISKETVQALQTRKIGYILGARMRAQKEVRDQVLGDTGGYQVVHPPRSYAKDASPLEVKEVWVDNRRYVVCVNEEQTRKDARDRAHIVEALQKQLERGDKSLVGNRGYRKFLRPLQNGFEIDSDKVDKESRYDGRWVLKTNTDMATDKVALTYKMLWMVEQLFRTLKSLLETRPIFHKWDETIRGHVFCSFLALVLMRELQDRMEAKGFGQAEWADVLRDLDNLHQTEVQSEDGKRFAIRSELKGWCGKTFQAAAVAIPPAITMIKCDEAL